jgi:tRNA U34 5-carboxymethylaminomethyl modifying GTPase MnmE/TrmE
MILYLYDAQIGIDKDDLEILDTLKITNPNILVIANKIDQVEKKNLENICRYQSNDLLISILDERNIIELKESIISYLKKSIKNSSPGLYNIENVKHLNRAFKEINQINLSLGELEITAEYLKKAQKYISMVLDNDNDDRVLSGIFSNFCIGK